MKNFLRLFFSLAILLTTGSTALAATTPVLRAERMVASAPVTTLDQLEVYSYTIGYKNTGTATWSQLGTGAVTIKTTEAVKVEHWFASAKWIDKTTVARLNATHAKPGEIAYFTLVLQAPLKTGKFPNTFALYTGNGKINGTDFSLPITVSNKVAPKNKQVVPTSTTPTTPATSTSAGATTATAPTELKTSSLLKAQLMLRSTDSVTLESGQTAELKVAFKNTGERNWRNADPSFITLEAKPDSVNFRDASWTSDRVVTALPVPLTKIGELGFFTFKIKAPGAPGNFKPQFRLVMHGDTFVQGSDVAFLVTVTTPPPPPPPVLANVPSSSSSAIVCAAADESVPPGTQSENASEPGSCNPPRVEPIIRIGITNVQGQLGATSAQPFQVLDSAGTVVMNVTPNATVFLAYDISSKMYTAVGPGPVLTSPTPYRVRGASEPSVVILSTFANPAAYNANLNDNAYRGSIEIRWSENDQKLWVINELKMEEYLKGLAEASNGAPHEYQKALIVAARSYALYHYQTNSKHRARGFHLLATVSDQYYRGYNSELRLPNIAAAVEETRGQVVTYQGQVVITPYSAASDGTSRTWEEVWGGSPKPWLIRQTIPEDIGRTLYGHGVGLSQLAAADQAKAGKNYVQISKFFYFGTEVSQWY